jgi:hypothetical protein
MGTPNIVDSGKSPNQYSRRDFLTLLAAAAAAVGAFGLTACKKPESNPTNPNTELSPGEIATATVQENYEQLSALLAEVNGYSAEVFSGRGTAEQNANLSALSQAYYDALNIPQGTLDLADGGSVEDLRNLINSVNANSPLAQYNTATFGMEQDKDGQNYMQWYGDPEYQRNHPEAYYKPTNNAPAVTNKPQLSWNIREGMPMAVYLNPTNNQIETSGLSYWLGTDADRADITGGARVGEFVPLANGSAEAPKLEVPGMVVNFGRVNLERNGVNAGSPDVTVYKFNGKVDLPEFISNIRLPYIYKGEEISYAPDKYKYFHTDSLKFPNITVSTTHGETVDSMWGGRYPAGTPVGTILREENGATGPLSDTEYKVGGDIWFGGYAIRTITDTESTSFVVYKYLHQERFDLVGTVPNVNDEEVLKALDNIGTDISPKNP